MPVLPVVKQRVGCRAAVKVAVSIIHGIETVCWLAAFARTLNEVVLERIHAGQRDVRITRHIILRVEFRNGADLADPPMLEEVREAQCPRRHIVSLAIPTRLEMPDRRPAFSFAVLQVVQ